jgi:glutathione peroxidase
MANNVYGFTVQDINGKQIPLENFKGKALLIVNVASKCGLTPQYEGLESIYKKYQAQGLEVLGFPANEFAGQEPGSDSEIQQFCTMNFGVKFPMFSKIVVKGEGQHPLYSFLTTTQPVTTKEANSDFEKKLEGYGHFRTNPTDILWNFEKFLIARDGTIAGRFAPEMEPTAATLVTAIEKVLG